jgi:hypothetical protein
MLPIAYPWAKPTWVLKPVSFTTDIWFQIGHVYEQWKDVRFGALPEPYISKLTNSVTLLNLFPRHSYQAIYIRGVVLSRQLV